MICELHFEQYHCTKTRKWLSFNAVPKPFSPDQEININYETDQDAAQTVIPLDIDTEEIRLVNPEDDVN